MNDRIDQRLPGKVETGKLQTTLTNATRRLSRMMPSSSEPRPNIYCATPNPYFSQTGRAAADRRNSSMALAAIDLLSATSAAG